MANRFLETNYYKSPYVRSLKGSLKALYSFIICDCTGAGIWALDLEAASMYIGYEITMEEFQEFFVEKNKAILIGGGKYFFPDFIEHQYPKGLSNSNPAHKNVIFDLKKMNLIDDDNEIKKKGTLKGLLSPIGYGNGNGYGNGKEMDKEWPSDTLKKFLIPEMQKIWEKHKPDYTVVKERDFTPLQSIASFICKHQNINYYSRKKKDDESLYAQWESISKFVAGHNFYNKYNLAQVEKYIQTIIQEQKNGTNKFTGGASTNGSQISATSIIPADKKYRGRL